MHLEEARRDDLIGVDVVGAEHDGARGERGERAHRDTSVTGALRTSVTRPVTAAAAAVSGEARNVRPPLPCRPSKLRLLVLTAYWPGLELVAVHGDAHRAARLAPLGAGVAEDAVEPLGLGLRA